MESTGPIKNRNMMIRVSDEERDRLKRIAKMHGKSVSGMMLERMFELEDSSSAPYSVPSKGVIRSKEEALEAVERVKEKRGLVKKKA